VSELTLVIAIKQLFKWLFIACLGFALSGCLGASVGQQVVQSILLHGADKATESAIEAHERNEAIQAKKNAKIDPYTLSFMNAKFEEVKPQIEPLPTTIAAEEEIAQPLIQESKLIQVEIWSLLAGVEKISALEKARLLGSPEIPAKAEWDQWQIATGAQKNSERPITFLIPPEMGKMRSGEKAMVELLPATELNMARYSLNQH
jgi:hypothetical protein